MLQPGILHLNGLFVQGIDSAHLLEVLKLYETEPNNLCARDRGLLACQCRACARTTDLVVSQQNGVLHRLSNLNVSKRVWKNGWTSSRSDPDSKQNFF